MEQNPGPAIRGVFFAALFLPGPVAVNAQSAASADSLQARLDALEQQVRAVARLNEIAPEDAQAAGAKRGRILADENGIGLSSADGAFVLRNRGFLQSAGTHFFGNGALQTSPASPAVTASIPALNNNYAIRRLQTEVNGTAYKHFDWRVQIDLGGGVPALMDASLDWKIVPGFNLRAGKFKPPTGLERLIATPRAPFVEGSFVTLLQPNRDLGVQAFGSFRKGLLEYQAGVFDGARDGQNNTTDNNDEKDIYLRFFSHPFVDGGEWLEGFGVGISGSRGRQDQYNNLPVAGTATTAFVPAVAAGIASYSTGRQSFFVYAANDTSVGTVARFSPQASYYAGPLGILAEYSATTQDLRRGAHEDRLTNAAWALTGSWFLTGEKNSYGGIRVKRPNAFSAGGGIGALEVLARAHGLNVDEKAFAALDPADPRVTYADPARQASAALGFGAGLGWYLNGTIKIFAGYEQVRFTGGAGASATASAPPVVADRDDENVLTFSLNVAY